MCVGVFVFARFLYDVSITVVVIILWVAAMAMMVVTLLLRRPLVDTASTIMCYWMRAGGA